MACPLHDQAMIIADEALSARDSGDAEGGRALAALALPLEVEAARRTPRTIASEPARSILYFSAASLAHQAAKYDEALALIVEGQTGWPPPRTAHDLRALQETVIRQRLTVVNA